MTNLIKPSEKTNLEKFYQGWQHFSSMSAGENFIVFKVSNHAQAISSVEAAKERIKELGLPLVVFSDGPRANSYIVKEISQHVEPITDNMLGAYSDSLQTDKDYYSELAMARMEESLDMASSLLLTEIDQLKAEERELSWS